MQTQERSITHDTVKALSFCTSFQIGVRPRRGFVCHLERNGACTVGPGKVPHAFRRHHYTHSSAVRPHAHTVRNGCRMGAEWVQNNGMVDESNMYTHMSGSLPRVEVCLVVPRVGITGAERRVRCRRTRTNAADACNVTRSVSYRIHIKLVPV